MASQLFWILIAALSIISYTITLVYRLLFHPLAKFPGSWMAAATQWYEAYFELVKDGGSQFASKVRDMHAEYGPIIRINPDEISVNDPEFHEKLYAARGPVRDRHPSFSAILGTTKGTFSTVDHHLHRNRRNGWVTFFSSANTSAAEPMMQRQVADLCNAIWSRRDQQLDLRTYLAAFSLDGFYTFAFGESLSLLDDLELASHCNKAVETLVTSPPFHRVFPTVMRVARSIPHSMLRQLSSHFGRIFDLHALILKAAGKYVQKNCITNPKGVEESYPKEPSQPETLFSALLRSRIPLEEKSASRMAQEGTEMFMAAFTPGRMMTIAMYHIHADRNVLETLVKELREANPDLTSIASFKALNALPYMTAVTKESLRIGFPVASRFPLICHEDITYGEWVIPAGTPISVNHRNLMMDPDVFPEPDKFKPERWLDTTHPIDEKRYFIPFGRGARGCPSKEFATRQIMLVVAGLIQRFEFELVDTIWERDVAVCRESILAAPSLQSKGIRFRLVGRRT